MGPSRSIAARAPASEKADATAISASKDWKVLASADFEEDVYATPALADGKLYLRTAKHLYCFGLPPGK